jgi:nucleoside-diphosphate-sugar epimerase
MKIIGSGLGGTIGRHIQNVNSYTGDIRNRSNYVQLQGFDSFLHLAGVVGAKNVDESMEASYDVNVTATLELAQEVIKQNYAQFIYVSTSHVYGKVAGKIDENVTPNPITNYAKQKLEAEYGLKEIFRGQNTKLITVRLFSILGANMPSFTLGGFLDQMSLNSNQAVSCSDDIRDFLSPRQAADALKMIAEKRWVASDTFNLCTGVGYTVKEAAQLYFARIGVQVDEVLFASGNSDVPVIIGNNSKLIQMFPEIQNALREFNPSRNES